MLRGFYGGGRYVDVYYAFICMYVIYMYTFTHGLFCREDIFVVFLKQSILCIIKKKKERERTTLSAITRIHFDTLIPIETFES